MDGGRRNVRKQWIGADGMKKKSRIWRNWYPSFKAAMEKYCFQSNSMLHHHPCLHTQYVTHPRRLPWPLTTQHRHWELPLYPLLSPPSSTATSVNVQTSDAAKEGNTGAQWPWGLSTQLQQPPVCGFFCIWMVLSNTWIGGNTGCCEHIKHVSGIAKVPYLLSLSSRWANSTFLEMAFAKAVMVL